MSNGISEQFQKINELLKGAQNIFITSHENPDADAVGSVLAMSSALDKQNFKNFIYLPDEAPQYLNFLPGFEKFKKEIPSFDFDLLICLDYGDFGRLKLPQNFSEEKIITLDHHLEGEQKGNIKIVDPEFSSTAEIIYLWLVESELEISKEIAICLLAGIISDTGGFKHVSTSPQTLEIASHLISLGAPLESISRQVLTSGKSLTASKIWAEALSRVTLDSKNNFAFSWISFDDLKKNQASTSDLNGISSLISTISGASMSLFLVEYEKGKIKGSLRSEPYKGKKINEMAKAMGGNGHPYAAGFKQEGSVEEVIKRVYNLIS
jgi:phosphoesterase RecJ-like protein